MTDQVNALDIETHQPSIVSEVKNVKSQSFTQQLKDDVDLVGPGGTVNVVVREDTKISGPLQRAQEDELNPIRIQREL